MATKAKKKAGSSGLVRLTKQKVSDGLPGPDGVRIRYAPPEEAEALLKTAADDLETGHLEALGDGRCGTWLLNALAGASLIGPPRAGEGSRLVLCTDGLIEDRDREVDVGLAALSGTPAGPGRTPPDEDPEAECDVPSPLPTAPGQVMGGSIDPSDKAFWAAAREIGVLADGAVDPAKAQACELLMRRLSEREQAASLLARLQAPAERPHQSFLSTSTSAMTMPPPSPREIFPPRRQPCWLRCRLRRSTMYWRASSGSWVRHPRHPTATLPPYRAAAVRVSV